MAEHRSRNSCTVGRRCLRAALRAISLGVLLVLGSSVLQVGPAFGAPTASTDPATVNCTGAAGSWTDCSIVVGQAIPAGGSIIAAVNDTNVTLAYCSDGTPAGADCHAYGTEVILFCPAGCAVGRQFDVGAVGTTPTALAASLNVALGATDVNWPGPNGLSQGSSDPGMMSDPGMSSMP